jgi:hypothetical protein
MRSIKVVMKTNYIAMYVEQVTRGMSRWYIGYDKAEGYMMLWLRLKT